MLANRQGRLVAMAALFLIVLGVLLTWSLGIARYGGPDEPGHALRAASVAGGELVGDRIPGLAPGFRTVTVPAELATGDPSCFRHDATLPATCATGRAGGGDRTVGSSAGTNPPLYYAVVGIAVRAAGDPASVLWYRVAAAVLVAGVLTAAVGRARRLGRHGMLLALAALSPATWFLFGVTNPNSAEIALALLSWIGAVLVLDGRQPRPRDVLWCSVPISVAMLMRPVAAMAWLAIASAVIVVRRGAVPSDRRSRLAFVVPPTFAAVCGIVWSRWSDVVISDERTVSRAPFGAVLRHAIGESTDTVRQISGSLGWLEFSAPSVVQVGWWMIVAGSGVVAWRRRHQFPARFGAWCVVLAVAVVGPIAFETTFAHRIGFIWQGRYSIPTVIGLVVLGAGAPLRAGAGRGGARLSNVFVVGLAAGLVVAEVATFWTALRRYTVGVDGSWWLQRAAWHPPLPPFVLLAANALLFGALAAIAVSGSSVLGLGDLAAHDVEGAAGPEPLDLLGAEGVHALEVEE